MSELQRRLLTPARLSLGATNRAASTSDQLAFALDHAMARDAVHALLDADALLRGLTARGLRSVRVESAAGADRRTYLLRPDLGRILAASSRAALQSEAEKPAPDVVFVLADGLSALAVERHALPLLDALLPMLGEWVVGPVVVATSARVALGDEIGEALHACVSVTLIGERPGLSSPDSLGVYLTWDPRPGRTDAERNCISNIRQEGLRYEAAADRIAFLLREARKLGATGVVLKDGSLSQLTSGDGS